MAQQPTAALGVAPATRFDPLGPFVTYGRTVVAVVNGPAPFFRDQALRHPTAPVTPSLVFALASIGLSTLVGWLLGAAVPSMALATYSNVLLCAVIGGALTLGPGSILVHLLVKLLVPGHKGYRFTLRALAYSQVAALAACLPGAGGASVLGAVGLSIVGVREVHQTTPGRAAVVVLVPATLLGLLELTSAAVWFIVAFSNPSWQQ